MMFLLFVSSRSILLSCLVGSLTSWVSPKSSMILSSRSELKDQFVVGSRSFHSKCKVHFKNSGDYPNIIYDVFVVCQQ